MRVIPKASIKVLLKRLMLPVMMSTTVVAADTDVIKKADKHSPAIDLILVVESTTGMKAIDPEELRKEASKNVIALLDPQDRASIISFSGDGYPVAYLTTTNSKKNIATLFSAVQKLSAKGQYRNLHGALGAVKRVIERNPPTSQRPTHVVVLSLGPMQLAKSDKTNQLKNNVETGQLPWFKNKGITIHGFLLGKQNDYGLLEKLAQQTNGQLERLSDSTTLIEKLHALLTKIKKRHNIESVDKSFTVKNGTASLQLLQNGEPGLLELTTPSGKNYNTRENRGSVSWVESGKLTAISIQNPEPGQWQMSETVAAITSFRSDTVGIKYKLMPDTLTVNDKLRVVAWLENNDTPITDPKIVQFVQARIQIEHANGDKKLEKSVSSLFPMKTQPGKFTATIDIKHSGDTIFQLTMEDDSIKEQVEIRRTVVPVSSSSASDNPSTSPITDSNEHGSLVSDINEPLAATTGLDHPQLKSALIIFTIANGIFIVFGLITYVMKRKLNQSSTSELTILKSGNDEQEASFNSELDSKAA